MKMKKHLRINTNSILLKKYKDNLNKWKDILSDRNNQRYQDVSSS